MTLRDSEQQFEASGYTSEILSSAPQLPNSGAHVWAWWQYLSNKRQCGMSINPISEEATYSFFQLRRIIPKQWELDALDGIESVFLNDYHDQQKKPEKKK